MVSGSTLLYDHHPQGASMYRLIITNKNYSSWFLRPWVLMRERAIPFIESLIPMGDEQRLGVFVVHL